MKGIDVRKWLRFGVMGAVLIVGCRHSRRCCTCDCCPTSPVAEKVSVLPGTSETVVVHHTAEKRPEEATIAMTVLSPGQPAGTLLLTATQAQAMGVRPGYTPDALFVAPSGPLALPEGTATSEKKAGSAEESEKKGPADNTPTRMNPDQ